MTDYRKTPCPDANTLAEFVEGKLLQKEHADLFLHIANCPVCKDFCQFAAKELARRKAGKTVHVSQTVKNRIRTEIQEIQNTQTRFSTAWINFADHISNLFQQVENTEVLAASEFLSVVTFASDSEFDHQKWVMKLFVPAQISENLPILIEVPNEQNVSGKLTLCGNTLDVRNGKAEISYQALKESFGNPEVAFCFRNGERISGHPEL